MIERDNETRVSAAQKMMRKPLNDSQATVLTDDVKWNRYWRFRQIIKTKGGTNIVADMLKMTNSYITQIASDKPKRAIGNKIATRIEKAFGLPEDSLDLDPPEEVLGEDNLISEIFSSLSCASEREKKLVLDIAKVIVKSSNEAIPPDGMDL